MGYHEMSLFSKAYGRPSSQGTAYMRHTTSSP